MYDRTTPLLLAAAPAAATLTLAACSDDKSLPATNSPAGATAARPVFLAEALPTQWSEVVWGHAPREASIAFMKVVGGSSRDTQESYAMRKGLVARAIKFVGKTVTCAHTQACGLVNDHLVDCWRYQGANK